MRNQFLRYLEPVEYKAGDYICEFNSNKLAMHILIDGMIHFFTVPIQSEIIKVIKEYLKAIKYMNVQESLKEGEITPEEFADLKSSLIVKDRDV